MDPGPYQVMHGEKGMAILQDKFFRFLASWLLPLLQPRPQPTGHCCVHDVLEYFAIKTSHLNLVSLKTATCEGGAFSSGHVLVQTCKSFHQHVEAAIAKNGGHID